MTSQEEKKLKKAGFIWYTLGGKPTLDNDIWWLKKDYTLYRTSVGRLPNRNMFIHKECDGKFNIYPPYLYNMKEVTHIVDTVEEAIALVIADMLTFV